MLIPLRRFFHLIPSIGIFIIATLLIIPNLLWIKNAYTSLYDPFNFILFSLVLVLSIEKFRKKDFRKLSFRYQFRMLPFALSIISFFLWSYTHYIIGINIFAASFGFAFIFALLGLHINYRIWLQSIIPVGLLLMTLPFGEIMDVYIGFPLRLLTVDILTYFLKGIGWHHITSNTIISVDNTASQIDYSCSGMKGLWAGLLFYLTLTWIENIKLGFRWFATLLLFLFLLVSANIIRIFIIIALTSKFNQEHIAQVLHAPIGIIGFAFSCAIVLAIMRIYLPKNSKKNISIKKYTDSKNAHQSWTKYIFYGLFLSIVLMNPIKKDNLSTDYPSVLFPENWHATPLDLSTEEEKYFKKQGSIALKMSFSYANLNGSFLIITSQSWKGHHNPTFCIQAGGNKIKQTETLQIEPNFPIKWMLVNQNDAACYWFQSPSFTTDDYSTRVWSDIRQTEKKWMLISIVFNQQNHTLLTDKASFLSEFHHLINNYYKPKL